MKSDLVICFYNKALVIKINLGNHIHILKQVLICALLFLSYPRAYGQSNTQHFACSRQDGPYATILSKAYQIPIVKNNLDFIQALMDKYNFSDMNAIAYVLYKEHIDNGFLDSIQDSRARTGRLKYGNSNFTMISSDFARGLSAIENASDVKYLEQLYIQDSALLRQGKKPQSRNANGSGLSMGGHKTWYFSTLGPAQINLYIAFIMLTEDMIVNDRLIDDIYSFGGENELSLHRLAYQLVDEKVNLEFLVAYLKWAYDVYANDACLDLYGKLGMVWELHTMGWFEYYAQNRYNECQCENEDK